MIGIIAVLAGMLMAGIMYAPAKAQKAKAQAEITTLVNAIKQYESTYGVLPMATTLTQDGPLTNANYKKLIHLLQADAEGLSDSDEKELKKMNKRWTKFLDIQGNDPGEFTDPWGENYNVLLDYDYDGYLRPR